MVLSGDHCSAHTVLTTSLPLLSHSFLVAVLPAVTPLFVMLTHTCCTSWKSLVVPEIKDSRSASLQQQSCRTVLNACRMLDFELVTLAEL